MFYILEHERIQDPSLQAKFKYYFKTKQYIEKRWGEAAFVRETMPTHAENSSEFILDSWRKYKKFQVTKKEKSTHHKPNKNQKPKPNNPTYSFFSVQLLLFY